MNTSQEKPEGNKWVLLQPNLPVSLLLTQGLYDDVVILQNNILLLIAFIKNKKKVDYFNYPVKKPNIRRAGPGHHMPKGLYYIMKKLSP